MAISYTRQDTGDIVDKEPWVWVAHYNDGTRLEQFEVSAKGAFFHTSAEIDAQRLVQLQLIHDTYTNITVRVPEGATPVHFYRNRHTVEEFTDEQGQLQMRSYDNRLYIVGFRLNGLYWLVYTDKYGNTLYSNDDKLYVGDQ